MNNLKIKRIEIHNFKIFKSIVIDLKDSDVVVFDGPNGFGKTSVFDAIELLLTGKISRLIRKKNDVDLRRTFEDNLLVNDQALEETYIKAEILYNQKLFYICRYADWKKHTDNNPIDFSPFSLHFLNDFKERPTTKNKSNESKIEELFGSNFVDSYPVMHYIEQDESAFLLKRREGDRKEFLSYLFHTVKEEAEYNKIKQSLVILKNKESEIESAKSLNQNRLKIMKEQLIIKELEDIPYKRLTITTEAMWDKKDISFGVEKWNTIYKQDILNLKYLVINKTLVKQALVNSYLNNVSSQVKTLQYHVTTSHFASKLKQIQNSQQKKVDLEQALELLTEFNELEDFEQLDFEELSTLLDLDEDFIDLAQNKYDELVEQKESLGEKESFFEELEETREQIVSYLSESDYLKDSDCPLCGHEYENKNKLTAQIGSVTEKFQQYLKKGSQVYRKGFIEFKKNVIDKLKTDTDKKIKAIVKTMPPHYYSLMIQDQRTKDSYDSFKKELVRFGIDISQFVNTDANAEKSRVDDLIRGLKKKLVESVVAVDSNAYNSKYKELLDLYFSGNFASLDNITQQDINRKISYIENEITKKQSEAIISLEKTVSSADKSLKKIEKIRKQVRDLYKIYESEINKYKSRVISLIEIPFYVYSGRIIQTFNRGSGFIIDIDMDKELKGVRFKANSSTSHDALFSLSSGQLSALVISFMLSLNRVYAKNNVILIDDPVQTMDDVNIASLIELLRNDFRSHQVFLSTHEDHISLYMNYKFGITKMNSNSFNMKKIIRPKVS